MFNKFSIAAVVIALAAPAIAQQSPSPAATPMPAAEKKTCRRETPTGSFMPGKPVCHTKAEWKEIDGSNSEAAQNALSRRSGRLNGQ